MHIIGIDWAATDEKKCGLALAELENGTCELRDLVTGASMPSLDRVAGWLKAHPDALVGIDAPLGWPASLARAVAEHEAGQPLGARASAEAFFSRVTDRFVRETFGKVPLEVGADRIARTAFSALCLIAELREKTRLPLALAWSPSDRGVIEVYPAATFKVLLEKKVPSYKKQVHKGARPSLLDALATRVTITPTQSDSALASDHLLDAIACVAAGRDFVEGVAISPRDDQRDAALREGWIWVRRENSHTRD